MVPYFVMVGVPAFLAILGKKSFNQAYRNRLIIGSFFFIWLVLLCLRKETIGIDLINYEAIFLNASRMSYFSIIKNAFSSEIEVGYYILAKTISLFSINFRFFIICMAVLAMIPTWLLYHFNAKQNSYLTIVIFLTLGLFSVYFSAIRQVLAMGFVFPAYEFVKRRRFWLFFLMVLLAFTFHHSAVIIMLMYPIYHIRFNWLNALIIVVPSLVVVYFFRRPIFSFLARFMGEFYHGNIGDTGAIAIFLLLVIFLVYSFFIPGNSSLDSETIGLRNLLYLSTILQVFSSVNLLAMRMNYYFLMLVPLLIPRIANSATEKNKKLAEVSLLVMVVFFTVFYFFRAYTSADILHVYPYIPMWK